jgi:poly(A) polymerase
MRAFALDVVQTLRNAGFSALWAGGCVRDFLLGHDPHDYDVATDALPDQVQKLFKRTLAVGAQFGVIEVLGSRQLHVQVATFRSDAAYSDGRHPDAVRFGTPQEDAQRRDFTINGLFYDPINEQVIDYVEGRVDLEAKIVRAIGAPQARIQEDKLRMLRAVRFVSRLQFALDPATQDAIASLAGALYQVSAERITDELKKMLIPATRRSALVLLLQLGLLRRLLPEFTLQNVTFSLSGSLPNEPVSFPLAWAALLLDLQQDVEQEGNRALQKPALFKIAARFRFSNQERDAVSFLTENLIALRRADELEWSRLKPILSKSNILDLLTLLTAACHAWNWEQSGLIYCRDRLAQWSKEDLEPPSLITGEDVAQLGIARGPQFKVFLDAVRREQLNETIRSREEALQLLQKLAKT